MKCYHWWSDFSLVMESQRTAVDFHRLNFAPVHFSFSPPSLPPFPQDDYSCHFAGGGGFLVSNWRSDHSYVCAMLMNALTCQVMGFWRKPPGPYSGCSHRPEWYHHLGGGWVKQAHHPHGSGQDREYIWISGSKQTVERGHDQSIT